METILKRISLAGLATAALLVIMWSLMLQEASQNTAVVDESPHLVAGYSYVKLRDYRLNPEHPPLIKILAGLPLVFQDINFPSGSSAWKNDINGQWLLGSQFLYVAGNNPGSILFWGRLGPILITLALGLLLFLWTRKLYGYTVGLFALLLFVFSPEFLAHGSLITTDVGASFAFLFATFFFIKYLQKQTKKNLVLAGIAFGIAQLMKFSLILLIPYFVMLTILWVVFKDRPLNLFSTNTIKKITVYFGKLFLIGVIGLLIVYPLYQYTVWNYPAERQLNDTIQTMQSSPYPPLAKLVIWMSDKPVLRAYAQFFMGHLMVFQRVTGGNTVYFLGDVSATAWWYYFPVVFLIKVPLALILLIGIAKFKILKFILVKTRLRMRGLESIKIKIKSCYTLVSEWIAKYFVETAFLLFIFFYWIVSILGNLNIGIRHVLPTFPFIYIVLAGIISRWIKTTVHKEKIPFKQIAQNIFSNLEHQGLKLITLLLILIWYVGSSISVFPNSLAYFNEFAGGPNNGYKYVVDSNLDWGQNLQGLVKYVKTNNIEKIKVDYFGGGEPRYYLGDKYEKFDPSTSERTGWIAISASLLQSGRGQATKEYDKPTDYYMWLNDYEPVAKIGYSIFVYHI